MDNDKNIDYEFRICQGKIVQVICDPFSPIFLFSFL